LGVEKQSMMISKPRILFFNPARHALAVYKNLSSVTQTEVLASKSRAELFQDLKGIYNNIVAIYSTSSSYAVSLAYKTLHHRF
jgi:glyoxylate reductase